jgi:hypothetical protein
MSGWVCFVPGVPGLCRVLCRVFPSVCRVCRVYIRGRGRVNVRLCASDFLASCAYMPRHTRHTRHILCKSTTYKKLTRHNVRHTRHTAFLNELEVVMGDAEVSRTIRCTEANARDFQRLVKADAGLVSLVADLQRQGVFPGLRGMSVTLTGTPEHVARGLDAWPVQAEGAIGGAVDGGEAACK